MDEPASDDRAEQWRIRCHLAGVNLAGYADREVQLLARVEELQLELDAAGRTIDAVVTSRSWRLTGSLR